MEQPKNVMEVRDFAGLVVNADPDDIAPGAAIVQENLQCVVPAEAQARGGFRNILFQGFIDRDDLASEESPE